MLTLLNKYVFKLFYILILFGITPSILKSQISKPDTIKAYKIDSSIYLDAELSEPCWGKAQRISNFTQRESNFGMPVSERTEAAIVYNEHYLYVGVWCYDAEPSEITAKEMKWDFPYWLDDNFEIVFDTYNDNRNGYIFVVNPNGAMADLLVSGDGAKSHRDWNGIWRAKARIDSTGWFAEIEIPFTTLKFKDLNELVWGINFERNIRRKREASFWQGWSRNYDFEHVSQAGTLIGLSDINSGNNLEIKPFISYGANMAQGMNPIYVSKIGGDINYSISPTIQVNLTANTDFAQVESDRIQVNLSRFSISYPEKRDFFLKGADLFEFSLPDGANLFYTRSIGIGAGTNPDTELREEFEVPIIVGLKSSAQFDGTRLGIMSILTDEERNCPSAANSVFRLTHDYRNGIILGALLTAYNSNSENDYTYAFDLKYDTPNLLGEYKLNFGVYFAQSIIQNQIFSADDVAYSIYANFPNDLLSLNASFTEIRNGFSPKLGFLRRTNFKRISFNSQYKPRTNSNIFNKLNFTPINSTIYFSNDTKELESAEFIVNPFAFTTIDGEYFEFSLSRNFERYDQNEQISSALIIPKGKYWFNRFGINYQSFEGRNFSFAVGIQGGQFFNGYRYEISSSITYYFSKNLKLSGEYNQYFVDMPETYLTVYNPIATVQYSFSTQLFCTALVQWNNLSQQIISNFRVNYIPSTGCNLYLVINSNIIKKATEYSLDNSTILLKYVHTFGI